MSIADILGGLPSGTTIKIGGSGSNTATSQSLKTTSSPTGFTSPTPSPKDCDPASEKWDYRTKRCVPRTFTPAEGERNTFGTNLREFTNTMFSAYKCQPGYYWDPTKGACVAYNTPINQTLDPENHPAPTPETPSTPGQYSSYEECRSHSLNDSYCRSLGLTPKGEGTHKTYAECIQAGVDPAACRKQYYGDTGTYLPDVEDATKTPSPFDNPEYYNWLVSPSGEMSKEELAYWDTQQQVITRTYQEGWNDIEAQISAMGGGYGTEMGEIQAIYTRDLEIALRGAYNEIMYTGLQRRLEEKKAAIDFYTNNKSLELSYAIANGQLTVEMLKTYINADVQYAGIEVDMLRAVTENALARVTSDVQIETLRQNWMLIAMQLGMNNAEAEAAFAQMLGNYTPESSVTGVQ